MPSTRKRRRVWWLALLSTGLALAWLLNVSRPGSHVEGCAQGCATAGATGDVELRVLSQNVLHGFPRFEHLRSRLDLIADEIRRQEVDLACLQEVPWTLRLGSAAAYLARKTGLNHVYLRANGNRWAILFEEGEAILSRYPLQKIAFLELRPRAGFYEHRAVLQATAVTPQGEVTLFCTHLTHGESTLNHAQFAALRTYVDRAGVGTAIVAGDLNAPEDELQDLAAGWRDTFRVGRPTTAGETCCIKDLARPERTLRKRIDYLYLAPGGEDLRIVDSRRILDHPVRVNEDWLWASDHVGVLTTLEAND